MYCVYFKTTNNNFKTYDGIKIETLTNLKTIFKGTFEIMKNKKNHNATDEGLMRYYKDIKISSDELKKEGFEYTTSYLMDNGDQIFYRNHYVNVKMFFQKYTKAGWDKHQLIDIKEAQWFEGCNNGGLTYVNPGTYKSYGYDFNAFYPRLMGDVPKFSLLEIPTKKGTENIISELPIFSNVPFSFIYGFYRVKITCNDINIHKIFNFSKNGIYTHYSLNFINELKTKHNFNINVELIQDGKPNAYLYNHNDLIKTNSIFNNWFVKIISLKEKYPDNILLKLLASSLWGNLSKHNTVFIKSSLVSKLTNQKLVDIVTRGDGHDYYELLDTLQPYKHNLRLKPFLISYGRNKTARVALRMLDNVIRIHTDGVCFNQPYLIKTKNLLPEAKTTGLIKFINVKEYHQVL